MKKLKYLLIFVLFLGISSVKAFDNTIKVYDYASKLTMDEETNLRENINKFIDTYNMDMVIVTVNYHTKSSTMAYADDFYDYNDFGIGNTKDGLIFVLDFYKSEFYISTTGEAIRVYDDYRINKMLDNIEVYKGNYYKMCEAFIKSASNYAKNGIPDSNTGTEIDDNGDLVSVKHFPIFKVLLIDVVITSIIMIILINKHKMIKKSVNANYYIDKDSLKINQRSDKFVSTHTTSTMINTQSSSSHSSGSSTHHSSSGRSHGGGGRRL